jgi:hypothetical protein
VHPSGLNPSSLVMPHQVEKFPDTKTIFPAPEPHRNSVPAVSTAVQPHPNFTGHSRRWYIEYLINFRQRSNPLRRTPCAAALS